MLKFLIVGSFCFFGTVSSAFASNQYFTENYGKGRTVLASFQNPFAQAAYEAGQGLGRGLNPAPIRDNQIISELVRSEQFKKDPMTAILHSRLDYDKKMQLLQIVGQFQAQQSQVR